MAASPFLPATSKHTNGFRSWLKRWWLPIAVASGIVCLAFFIFVRVYARPLLEKLARERTQQYLVQHFQGRVQFADLHIAFTPKLQVAVDNLNVRSGDRTDIAPLVQAKRITFQTTVAGLLDGHPRVSNVKLEGLVISTPPKMPGGPPMIQGTNQNLAEKVPIVLERIDADDALIVILRWDKKPPNQFEIHHLVLYNFRFD